MKLRRNFIGVKRLSNIGVNNKIRKQWILDYLKSLIKPLEYTSNLSDYYCKESAKYVLYNGQKLSLENYVNDEWDIIERRSWIGENEDPSLSFYGYLDENGDWVTEYDPNPTSFYGYATGATNDEFVLETDPDPKTLWGYVMFSNIEPLETTETGGTEYLYDNALENIYTTEGGDSNDYIFILEGSDVIGCYIWIHEDIYNLMSDEDKEELLGHLGKYFIAPTTYELRSFS